LRLALKSDQYCRAAGPLAVGLLPVWRENSDDATGNGSVPMPKHPPLRIETESLVVRCWSEADAPELREAIDSSLDHLRPWMPWALSEPATYHETVERILRWRAAFLSGEDFAYGLFDRDKNKVLGAGGLHRRVWARRPRSWILGPRRFDPKGIRDRVRSGCDGCRARYA